MASGSVQFRWSGLDAFAESLRRFGEEAEQELEREMEVIAARWAAEARRRVPVETGALGATLLHESGRQGSEFFAAVGSNQEYAPHIEFGTEWIAGGAVKAIGTAPDVTDSQAVRSWPAKDEGGGGAGEQMPFLRPAFMAIEEWAIKRLKKVIEMDGGR